MDQIEPDVTIEHPESVVTAPKDEVVKARPGFGRSAWRGALNGMQVVAYLVSPFILLALVPIQADIAFDLGARRSWPFTTTNSIGQTALAMIGGLLVTLVWGLVLGAAFGLIGRLFPPRLHRFLSRPFRGLSRRKSKEGPDYASEWRPGPTFTRWLFGVPIVLILLGSVAGLVAGIYLGVITDRKLAKAIAVANRDDPDWELHKLLAKRIEVPDDENSAILVSEVSVQIPDGWPNPPQPGEGERMPPASDLQQAFRQLESLPANVRLAKVEVDVLREELKLYDDAVNGARRVADFKVGRHEIELAPYLLNTPLPETQSARSVASLLAADAMVRAETSDIDGALDSCRAIFGVARSIGDEPFLISQLVHAAIGEQGLNALVRALAQGQASDAALARVQKDLIDEGNLPILLWGMRGERATEFEVLLRISEGNMPIQALSDLKFAVTVGTTNNQIAPRGRLMFDHQRAIGLEWMNDAVAWARLSPTEWPSRLDAWRAEVARAKSSWTMKVLGATIPLLMSPALDSTATAILRYECKLRAAIVLVAAERQRLKTGNWPTSTSAIDPAILQEPVHDPYGDGLIRMTIVGEELRCYSVGPNRKDEQGAYSREYWGNPLKKIPDDFGATGWNPTARGQASTP